MWLEAEGRGVRSPFGGIECSGVIQWDSMDGSASISEQKFLMFFLPSGKENFSQSSVDQTNRPDGLSSGCFCSEVIVKCFKS